MNSNSIDKPQQDFFWGNTAIGLKLDIQGVNAFEYGLMTHTKCLDQLHRLFFLILYVDTQFLLADSKGF